MKQSVDIRTGDALEELRKIGSGTVDLVVSSPPYNIGKEYETRVALDVYAAGMALIVAECERVLRRGGSLCWQVGNYVRDGEITPLDYVFIPLFLNAGLSLAHRIIWHFGHGLHATKRFSGRHETILWFTKDVPAVTIIRARDELGDVWKITNVKHNHPEKTAHPCQFPEGLIEPLVLQLTKPGAVVLDPFAGSGTVGAVAKRHGRRAILIDRDPSYAAIARRRIERVEPMLDLTPG